MKTDGRPYQYPLGLVPRHAEARLKTMADAAALAALRAEAEGDEELAAAARQRFREASAQLAGQEPPKGEA